MEEFAITRRKVWQRRNGYVFIGQYLHPTSVIKQSKQFLMEFKEVHAGSGRSGQKNNKIYKLEPPPVGTYKVN